MSTSPAPAAAPDAVAQHQCGRCRNRFDADPIGDPVGAGEWWVCPPCREALLPGLRRSGS